jgi:putative N6-adenine-specific DNA methylase
MRITGLQGDDLLTGRGGVLLRASWRDALLLNLHSRLAQRVLVQLSHTPYRNEQDLYAAASAVAWEIWFTRARASRSRSRPSTARSPA